LNLGSRKLARESKKHHLIKTFWGWCDQQLADGTLIWKSPSGQTYVTAPGSALLFPNLCAPTGMLRRPQPERSQRACPDRTAMMPNRRRTRAQNRAARINTERRDNHNARLARQAAYLGPAPPARGGRDQPATTTMTPGGWSATSGIRG
jgi:hypothetical protein